VSGLPRAIVEHEGRLDLLCCLTSEGPLTVIELSARTRMSELAVGYLLMPLEEYEIIRKTGSRVDQEPRYEARLDDQPAWVREAVEAHCDGGR
jgi:DNA-binding transcriptional ArsR family regulator